MQDQAFSPSDRARDEVRALRSIIESSSPSEAQVAEIGVALLYFFTRRQINDGAVLNLLQKHYDFVPEARSTIYQYFLERLRCLKSSITDRSAEHQFEALANDI